MEASKALPVASSSAGMTSTPSEGASTRHKAEAWYRSALPGRETLATPALAITAAVLERESLVHRIV